MVEMIDTSVGRIVAKLEADGELENTVRRVASHPRRVDSKQMIIFMSDK